MPRSDRTDSCSDRSWRGLHVSSVHGTFLQVTTHARTAKRSSAEDCRPRTKLHSRTVPSGLADGVRPWCSNAHHLRLTFRLAVRCSALRTSPMTWVQLPSESGIQAVSISSPVRKGIDGTAAAAARSWFARTSANELPLSSNDSPSVWDRIQCSVVRAPSASRHRVALLMQGSTGRAAARMSWTYSFGFVN